MNLYMLTIFIAEVIIFLFVIGKIIKFNKMVVSCNSELCRVRPNLEKSLKDFSGSIHNILTSVEKLNQKVKNKTSNRHLVFIAVNILLTIFIIKLKGRNKKIVSLFQLLMVIKDMLYKKVCYA